MSGEKTPREPLPANKYSLEYAVALWDQITKCDVTDPSDAEWLVEALRSVAELALWGDKNDAEVADFLLMESTMVSFIADIIDRPNLHKNIYVQCIQSVVILLQNHSRESTLFFILSNGKFNRFIEAKLDYSDEEIVSHFVSFLKSVTARLKAKNILPLFCSGGAFPLLAAAMNSALLTHDDRMVRTSVRQVIGQLLRIEDDAVKQFAQGCVPRLVDDLGAFMEAQLRNLSLLVTDESNSIVVVEMADEDIADEGLYLVDLLSGCTSENEKERMARTMREYVLERLLIHAQDSDSADVAVSTVVFMCLSRWLRSAPKWFIENCFMASAVPSSSFSAAAHAAENDAATTPVLLQCLSWALFASRTASHVPASTVTRSAMCVLGAVFQKLAAGEPLSPELIQKKSSSDENHQREIFTPLIELVRGALFGMSQRLDRTSGYNCGAMFFIAKKILGDDAPELRQFFDDIVVGSELFAPEQSSLRLEVLMAITGPELFPRSTTTSSDDAMFDVFSKDQWPTFIDDLRFPMKRQLKMREPISQSERVTHRSGVIAFLRSRLLAKEARTSEEVSSKLLLPPSQQQQSQQQQQQLNSSTNAQGSSNKPTVSGMLVNEEISAAGGLPSVFLTVEGNVLRMVRSEFGVLSSNSNNSPASNSNKKGAAAAASSERFATPATSSSTKTTTTIIPLVSLSLTQDVSRPFVLHFCSPQCCGIAPFSVSFPSRTVANRVLSVTKQASESLRGTLLSSFSCELAPRTAASRC